MNGVSKAKKIKGEKTCLVNILVGTRSTETVQTELLVGISLPTHGAHNLDGERRDTVGEDTQAVFLALSIKDLEARQGHDTSLNVVLLGEVLNGVNADADLGSGGNEGDVSTFLLVEDVSTLDGLVDDRAFELGKVLPRKCEYARSVLGGEGDVVSGAGLVSVSRPPDHHVGQGTEVGQRLDGLVGRAVLSETDRVVGGNPDVADARKRGQTDGTGSVGDEVEEGTSIRQDGTVGSEAVEDGTHAVLADTVTDVAAAVVAEPGGGRLEVDGVLPSSEVGASEIGRTTKELGDDLVDLGEDDLGQLPGSDGGVGRSVYGELLLPALGKITLQAADEVVMLGLELLAIAGQELVPLLLESGTLGSVLAVKLIDLLRHGEGLVRVEAELLLELLDVVGLERRAVDAVGSLLGGAETDDSAQLDQGGLVFGLLGFLESTLDAIKVVVAVIDDEDLPAIRLVPLDDILGEGLVGVTVDGDVVVVIDGDQVAELEVASQRGSLARDTLHQAAIAEEAVGVIVDEVETRLVEDSGGVGLAHGKTNSIRDTLA